MFLEICHFNFRVCLSVCPSALLFICICSSMCLIRLLPQLGCYDKIENPSHKENQVSLSLLKIVSILLLVSNFCLLRMIRTEKQFWYGLWHWISKIRQKSKKAISLIILSKLEFFPYSRFQSCFSTIISL